MSGFAMFAAGGIIVTYLALEPNRWLAIVLAGAGVWLQLRAIIQAGAEDPAELRRERES